MPARMTVGIQWAAEHARQGAHIERDIRNGLPLSELVERHSGLYYPYDERLRKKLIVVRNVKFGVFRHLIVDEFPGEDRSVSD
jgi:hypothetical protein